MVEGAAEEVEEGAAGSRASLAAAIAKSCVSDLSTTAFPRQVSLSVERGEVGDYELVRPAT